MGRNAAGSRPLNLLFSLIVALNGCGAVNHTNPDSAVSAPISTSYFGLVSAAGAGKRPWPWVTFGHIRTFDSAWYHVEPVKDHWYLSNLDGDVDAAVRNNVEIAMVLTSTPQWASARPSEEGAKSSNMPGTRAEAAHIEDWINYVRTIGERYKGKVRDYECWNEPDSIGSYSGDISHLADLCIAAYATLKSIDPSIVFVSSGFTSEGARYLNKYLRAEKCKSFDVLGFHFYMGNKAPEGILEKVVQIRSILRSDDRYSRGTQIWNTEFGYYLAPGPDAAYVDRYKFPPGSLVLDGTKSQAYVARSYIVGACSGLSRFDWYSWGNMDFALVDDYGYTSKPATEAYEKTAEWLVSRSIQRCSVHDGGIWTVDLLDQSGHHSWLVWRVTGQGSYLLPKDWRAVKAEDINGKESNVGSSFHISEVPVLLTSD